MTKLMQEEKKRSPTMVPKVEVHPVKISYSVTSSATLDDDATSSTNSTSRGFVYVSQRAQLYRVMDALMEVAAPKISVRCKRIWSKRVNATQSGDGFELLDCENTPEEPKTKNGEQKGNVKNDPKDKVPIMSLGEWAQTHGDSTHVNGLDVLIETKRSSSEWPRESLELENRIQVRVSCELVLNRFLFNEGSSHPSNAKQYCSGWRLGGLSRLNGKVVRGFCSRGDGADRHGALCGMGF
jgi:hypothetical protein